MLIKTGSVYTLPPNVQAIAHESFALVSFLSIRDVLLERYSRSRRGCSVQRDYREIEGVTSDREKAPG